MDIFLEVFDICHKDYISSIFDKIGDNVYAVTTTHPFGALCVAHAKESLTPVPLSSAQGVVHLVLPKNDELHKFSKGWLYYDTTDTYQLNMWLRTIFNLDFQQYYARGSAMKFTKKEIIEAFILDRHLTSVDKMEMLTKKSYRQELNTYAKLIKRLQNRAHYISASIDTPSLVKHAEREERAVTPKKSPNIISGELPFGN